MKLILGPLVVLLMVGALGAAAAAQEPDPPDLLAARQGSQEGALVYQANCAPCHQADGSGVVGAFPPLAGNSNATDAQYVESVVREGRSGEIEVFGVTYNAVMPAVELSEEELTAVVEYVNTLAAGGQPTPTTVAPSTAADAVRGERLFTGVAGFSEGGAACIGCHAAGDITFRGGSGLGPDLSNAYDRLGGEAGLSAWLTNPASATMQPLFADRPLAESEIADLAAFLATTTDTERRGGIDQVLVGGGLGLLILLGLMTALIRKPNESYNQRLRRGQ